MLALLLAGCVAAGRAETPPANPYDRQVAELRQRLHAPDPATRAGAAEALGFLRGYAGAEDLASALGDGPAVVRREAAMALGWCGGRGQVPALLDALGDSEWTVRQGAWVALTNLTGMEWPFDALAPLAERGKQEEAWRDWWKTVPPDRPPAEVLALLRAHAPVENLATTGTVSATSTYMGPPGVLLDSDPATFWQTKNVAFPQSCTLDLGAPREVGAVVIDQYGPGFCMTEFSLETSLDGMHFEPRMRRKERTAPRLVLAFPLHEARYVRVVSHSGENPTYPTTFREVEVYREPPADDSGGLVHRTRAARALGALGGEGATGELLIVIESCRRGHSSVEAGVLMHTAMRGLARQRDPRALPVLAGFLDNTQWARYAAEALGDLGDPRAADALIAAYPRYARGLDGRAPKQIPAEDRTGFTSQDRMHATPFEIASALARLPASAEALRGIAPLLLANLPSDFDGAVLYDLDAGQRITAHLLETAGLREAACQTALARLGAAGAVADPRFAQPAAEMHGDLPVAAQWLCVLCRNPGQMLPLLEHPNGWVRLNAARTLMFLGATNAVDRLAEILASSKTEAEHGYFGGFLFDEKPQGQDDYDDPPPRWREAYVRALGRLKAERHASLLAGLLGDDRNALEIQYAAAIALDEIGTPEAVAALRKTEAGHPFHTVRLAAREALWKRGIEPLPPAPPRAVPHTPAGEAAAAAAGDAIVFIKGPNRMPNAFQIDPWRQAYSTTDSGPTYRLGWNLFLLRGERVEALTDFKDGWVADCEVSADGQRILFARRGGLTDPWWHIWEMRADGGGLRQLTRGPYHDVQPNYLPDGRIVFASSRIGQRDEYHGYPATGLTVMNADGGGLRCIGFNLGRDNEPSVLPDGRIVFGRLDLFYSRLKTEITLQAVYPDGTKNVTLYGPERRPFWREVTRRSGENGWGEVPLRHRVLRLTQPQGLDDGRVLCATTGGLVLTGPGRLNEAFVPHDKYFAVTTPYPLDDHRILCAAVDKRLSKDEGNLGLCEMNMETGEMTMFYRDAEAASFEPRPLVARAKQPPVIPDDTRATGNGYSAKLFCQSVFHTQIPEVAARGRLVRVIEGLPVVARHHTHRSPGAEAWKNHGGTEARVLGTVPLTADGSFMLEVPADRLIHLQVLDSDRRVLGNQQVWMYARPGETRSCIGCHEAPDTAPPAQGGGLVDAARRVVSTLPTGGEFTYRAKAWEKGQLLEASEERTRTAGAVNLPGRP